MPNVLLFVLLLLPLVAQQQQEQQEQHLHKKILFASSLKLSNSPQQRVRILTTHSEAKPTLSTCRKFVPSRKCTFDHSLTKCPSQRINEMQIPTPPAPPTCRGNINGSNQSSQMETAWELQIMRYLEIVSCFENLCGFSFDRILHNLHEENVLVKIFFNLLGRLVLGVCR